MRDDECERRLVSETISVRDDHSVVGDVLVQPLPTHSSVSSAIDITSLSTPHMDPNTSHLFPWITTKQQHVCSLMHNVLVCYWLLMTQGHITVSPPDTMSTYMYIHVRRIVMPSHFPTVLIGKEVQNLEHHVTLKYPNCSYCSPCSLLEKAMIMTCSSYGGPLLGQGWS